MKSIIYILTSLCHRASRFTAMITMVAKTIELPRTNQGFNLSVILCSTNQGLQCSKYPAMRPLPIFSSKVGLVAERGFANSKWWLYPIGLRMKSSTVGVTTQKDEKIETEVKNTSFWLEMIPGNTNLQRSLYTVGTGGIAAAGIYTNVYIPTEETFMVVSFVIVVRALYIMLRKPVTDWTDAEFNRVHKLMVDFFGQERSDIESSILQLESYRDAIDVTSGLFSMRREIINMEFQLKAILDKNMFLQTQRAILEEKTRSLEEKKNERVRARNEALIQAVLKKISEKEIQQRILEKCISDLKSLKKLQ